MPATQNVLIEYGKTELHGILKSTFEEVSRQEVKSKEIEDGQITKRVESPKAAGVANLSNVSTQYRVER